VIGIALALVFVWIVQSSRDLSASVLSLSERAFIEEAHRDAAYKKAEKSLEIFISPTLQQYDQLFISLLFSPSKIELFTPIITSPYERQLVSQSAGSSLLQVSDFVAGNIDEGIILIPFSGDAQEITVEFVSDEAEGGTLFALGALETFTDETHM
jgi:hypothetical protein